MTSTVCLAWFILLAPAIPRNIEALGVAECGTDWDWDCSENASPFWTQSPITGLNEQDFQIWQKWLEFICPISPLTEFRTQVLIETQMAEIN